MALIKSYHCGGETLGTVVKHSVRDSKGGLPFFDFDLFDYQKKIIKKKLIFKLSSTSLYHRRRG